MASAHYETLLGGGSCIGGGGSGALRIRPSWQIVSEVSGCLVINMPKNESGDSEMYSAEFAGLPVLRSGSRLTARCLSAVGGSGMKLMIQKKGNNCETLGMTEAGRSHTIRCVVSGPRNTKRTDFQWQWAAWILL